MGEMGEIWRALKASDARRKQKNLEKADLTGFTKHTEWHYSCALQGDRLDYWPTKNKWRWRNQNYHGDVQSFIKKRNKSIDGQ